MMDYQPVSRRSGKDQKRHVLGSVSMFCVIASSVHSLGHLGIQAERTSTVDLAVGRETSDHAAVARGCRSLAPMMMSHSMMASSPNITGKTQFETLCSYCGHNMPVTLVAR